MEPKQLLVLVRNFSSHKTQEFIFEVIQNQSIEFGYKSLFVWKQILYRDIQPLAWMNW